MKPSNSRLRPAALIVFTGLFFFSVAGAFLSWEVALVAGLSSIGSILVFTGFMYLLKV